MNGGGDDRDVEVLFGDQAPGTEPGRLVMPGLFRDAVSRRLYATRLQIRNESAR
jgi:hypothetical protein